MPVELQTDQQLTAEEAEQLVREYKQNGSQELRNQLVMHYSYIAKGVVNRMGSTFYKYATAEEMIHQGVISLIDSLERFDPNKDVKFSTYAFTKVRGAIIDYVRKQDWLPRRIRKADIQISKVEAELTGRLGRAPTRAEMAEAMGMKPKEYDKCVYEVSGETQYSFEALIASPSSSHPSTAYMDEFDPQHNVDQEEFRKVLANAIDSLNEQERTVLSLYYYENLSMKEIGKVMHVSEQRIGQINRKLLNKLRDKLSQFVKG